MADSRPEIAKRSKAEALNLVDAGKTPLWFAPSSLQNESSMRSTLQQTAAPYNHQSLQTPPFSIPRRGAAQVSKPSGPKDEALQHAEASSAYTYASFTPINRCRSPVSQITPVSCDETQPSILSTTSETFRQHYGRNIPKITIDMYEVGEHELDLLDQDEGRVYHLGTNTGGSYSGRFPEQPLKPDLETMVANTISHHAEKKAQAVRNGAGAETEDFIRILLSAGLKLVLLQTPMLFPVTDGLECRLPGCLAQTEHIGPATFYLSLQSWRGHYSLKHLRHPGVERYVHRGSETTSASNMETQSEDSSSGIGSEEIRSVPFEESRHDPMSIPQLDDLLDLTMVDAQAATSQAAKCGEKTTESIYASRWATTENDGEEASPPPRRPSTPQPEHLSSEDDLLPDSPGSTDFRGQWLYPPRRIQYIAAFIEPSATLTPEVRAAVWLWKAASKAQLYWDEHMEKVQYNYLSMQKSHQAKEFQIEQDDYGEDEIRGYEELAGFSKKACYGNVLSEMLHRVRKY